MVLRSLRLGRMSNPGDDAVRVVAAQATKVNMKDLMPALDAAFADARIPRRGSEASQQLAATSSTDRQP